MSSHNINTTHKSSLFILYTNIKNLQRINVGSITGAHYALKTRPLVLVLVQNFVARGLVLLVLVQNFATRGLALA